MPKSDVIVIRDPIHGTFSLSPREIRLVDQPAFQRLRNIKQLGFADQAFPGATHSRYGHSLGAQHVATKLFDRLFDVADLPADVYFRFRQTMRLAILFHDLGHAPLSHTTEMLMPQVDALNLGPWVNDEKRRACHEDYTLKIVLDSSISESITTLYGDDGVTPKDVAALIHGSIPTDHFIHNGIDYAPVLRQIVSSECDADRMDYLQRDSFYCGVNYGKFDADWLIDNVTPVEIDGAIFLGIRSRAILSFEDFLLSRYHMFASVYLHYTPVIFEKIFARYIEESEGEFALPADVETYIRMDDIDLWHVLRKSQNPWAQRLVHRRPYALVQESDPGLPGGVDQTEAVAHLQEAGIDPIFTKSRSILSKYFGSDTSNPIFVVTGSHEVVPLEAYTPLYIRYKQPSLMERVYVSSENQKKAKEIIKALREKETPQNLQESVHA